ncbi:hypothetical protein AB6A40_003282 [Gnathostoma spinigerum]|uniref:Uncharacterized protein n=1 Tax=Gnathostoma spinigerum TaxID=75299 RepID=A0ABD6EHY9_9BILA
MSPSKTLSSTSTSSEEVVANNSSNACSPGGTSVAQRKTPVEEGSTEIYERCKEMAPSARITTKKDEVLTAVTTGISATFSPNSLSSRESACFVMNNSPKEKVSLLASIASTSTADETLTYDKKSKDSFHFSRDIIVSSHVADTESTSLIVPEVSLANASSMIYRLCPGNGVKAFAEVRDEIILNVNGGRTAYISENQKGNVSYTKSSNGMNCSKISSNPSQSESRLAKANANKSGERKIQDLNLGHMNSDEMTIKTLVNDIVNFTSYNMGDLAGIVSPLRTSSLLGSPQSSNSRSGSPLSPIRSMSMNHVEETESDDGVIHSVVRGLIRDVLAKEKELLVASIMKRKKFRTGKMPIIPTDPSP